MPPPDAAPPPGPAPGPAPADREPRIFGFALSPRTAAEIAAQVVEAPPPMGEVGLVVTPNIQHVMDLRRSPAFRRAYARARIVTCDGFPVYYYARLRGCRVPGRVTGTEIAEALMARGTYPPGFRPFFVVDSEATAEALLAWAGKRGLDDAGGAGARVATRVPHLGFERDPAYCAALAAAIRAHGTTLLVMGLGAPKSEVFVDAHRDRLPACWALCVGQAVKTTLGLARRAPKAAQGLNLEWLWRLASEPRRLGARYARSVVGFLLAVAEDLRGVPPVGPDDGARP